MLQQVMNHKDAGIFQAYINERVQCDVQAAFLGRPSADAVFKVISHVSRFADPRALSELTDSGLNSLIRHPDIVKFRQIRDSLSQEAQREFGTVKAARAHGSKIWKMYDRANADLHCAKVKLRKSAKLETRDHFFETIDTEELNAQGQDLSLDLSLLDLDEKDWKPEKVEHRLEERRRVAELLCEQPPGEEGSLERRVRTIEALVALCRVQETPAQQKRVYDRTWGIIDQDTTSDHEPPSELEPLPFPMTYTSKQCPFCFKTFCRPRKVREHAERQHLRYYEIDDLIPCPHPECSQAGVILSGHMHFKNHAAAVHKSFLFEKCR
jgi:hypothetical protein